MAAVAHRLDSRTHGARRPDLALHLRQQSEDPALIV
jgi:hypothetical protein